MKGNTVAKHAHKYNKSAVMRDRKKDAKKGKVKHKGRDYAKEYANYHSRPEQIKRRAARNAARRAMRGRKELTDEKDVHHKDNNPMNNDKSNLSIVTQHYNRREPRLRMEDLRKWFGKGKKGDWVRVGTDGEIKGDCAREPGEGKPKCMPRSKAHSMDKKDRASSARRKRRADPSVDRPGTGNKPIMVKTDKKESVEMNENKIFFVRVGKGADSMVVKYKGANSREVLKKAKARHFGDPVRLDPNQKQGQPAGALESVEEAVGDTAIAHQTPYGTVTAYKRDTKGMRGKQDGFKLTLKTKSGKTVDLGSHPKPTKANVMSIVKNVMQKESVALDELSPKTVKSYLNKRIMDIDHKRTQYSYQKKARDARAAGNEPESAKNRAKAKKIGTGIHRATARDMAHDTGSDKYRHKSVKRVPQAYKDRAQKESVNLEEALVKVTDVVFRYSDQLPNSPKTSDIGAIKYEWKQDSRALRDAVKKMGGLVTDTVAPSSGNKWVGTVTIGTRNDPSKLDDKSIQKAVKSHGIEIHSNQFRESVNIEEKNVPTNPSLWAKTKAQAKAKFDVYPSAYANGWAAKKYKAAGGGWKTESVKEMKTFWDIREGAMSKDKETHDTGGFRISNKDAQAARDRLKARKTSKEATALDELSPSTVGSYINKRTMGNRGIGTDTTDRSKSSFQAKARAAKKAGDQAGAEKHKAKAKKVDQGLSRAVARHHAQRTGTDHLRRKSVVKRVPQAYKDRAKHGPTQNPYKAVGESVYDRPHPPAGIKSDEKPPFEPTRKVGVKKDKFGNVVKDKNRAKHLAKLAMRGENKK